MSIVLQRRVPINKFKLKEDEFFKGRCAEVYLTNHNGFVLNCLFCSAKFRDFIMLKKHASAMHNYDCIPITANNFDDDIIKNEIITDNENDHEFIDMPTTNEEYCGAEDNDENNYSVKPATPPTDEIVNEVWTIIPYKEATDSGSTNNADLINLISFNESGGADEMTTTDLIDADEFYVSNDEHKEENAIPEENDVKYDNFISSDEEEEEKKKIASLSTVKVKKMERRFIEEKPEKKLENDVPEENDVKFENFVTSDEEDEDKKKKATQSTVKVKKMERRLIGEMPEKKSRPNNSNSERVHICPICSFAFTDRSNLKAHINRHSGEKKYECPDCAKRFFTRTEYDTHYRTHTGERPYICSGCGKGCLTAGELKVHERRHTNDRRYKCSYCEKKFFDGKHLKDHIVSHTQERKFVCEICNSRFLRRKSLKSHIKIHENKREYVCNICGNAYNQKPALSIHIRSKHGVHLHKADAEINKNKEY